MSESNVDGIILPPDDLNDDKDVITKPEEPEATRRSQSRRTQFEADDKQEAAEVMFPHEAGKTRA